MTPKPIYQEEISSNRTQTLFVALTLLSLLLFVWRMLRAGLGYLSAAFFFLFAFFLFYVFNYRTLIIRLTPEFIELCFGIFGWTIPLDAIQDCYVDDTSLLRIGGAGIHFTSIQKRYRAIFNFLEYPRLVIVLKEQRGPVCDVAFSTQQPARVKQLICQAIAERA